MGLNVIYEDEKFKVYFPDTFYDFSQISSFFTEKIYNEWKQKYRYIYAITNSENGFVYVYVPNNNTFSYKSPSSENYEAMNLNVFIADNVSVGNFLDTLVYEILKNIDNMCIVKQEKLTTERKTYIILITNREYIYTALAVKMNSKMINAFKENLDVCRQVEEYIHPNVLEQIYN